MASAGSDVTALVRAARRTERRLRLARALRRGTEALTAAVALAVVVVAFRKIGVVPERGARLALALLAVVVAVVAFFGYRARLPRGAGAVALDRHHGLADRVASALAFAALDPPRRTGFQEAAIADAVAHGARLDPRGAAPFRRPDEVPVLAAFAAALCLVAAFEVRRHVPVTVARTLDAVDVTADDVDALRDFVREMEQRAATDDAKAATEAFNQLIEDLAGKRLDRTETFRRMQALEDKLLEGREADARALEEALSKMGEEMKKADLTRPAGEALETKNLAVAEKALRDLAKRLRELSQKGAGVDKAQIEKMRDALKRAAEGQAKREEALAQRRQELEKQLLKDRAQRPDGGASEQEKSLLKKKERELERLDRESREAQGASRKLDRLDRELSKAAEDLMRDLGLSAGDLDQGAEDLNRMAKDEMTQQEKEQLRQKLDELREMLRQQGQGGQKQMVRLRRFQQSARSGLPRPGKGQQGGQQGQGNDEDEGDGKPGQPGGEGEGQEGQDGKGGQGQKGQGRGPQGETWVLGPNGEKIMVLSAGSKGGQGERGEGRGDPSKGGHGTGHDDAVKGAATSLKGGTQDTQVAGQDTGQGQSRSEVIHGAAERGFASRGYQKVYREYHTVAEEALNKDEIPGGYRFYVRRYFQLIRPREER